MTIWMASDHHIGHGRILEFEPEARGEFKGLQHMNSVIVARHNEVVADEDEVWFLGDLALGDMDQALSYASSMKGQKHLLAGNHDKFSKAYMKPDTTPERAAANRAKREQARVAYENAGFIVHTEDEVGTGMTIEVGGRTVLLSHYPYRGTERGDHVGKVERFTELRPVDEGLPLIHGHIHSLRGIQGRQFNAGIDLFSMYPVSETTIIKWLDTL